MRKTFIILILINLTLAGGCGKTGSGDEEAGIVFGEAGAFRLGETQEIGFSFTDGQDREVSVRNVPSGWQASVDNDANAISLTCGIDAGISGKYSMDIEITDNTGNTEITELVFQSEIVQGSPFFIGNEPVGVVVLEKTANSDGIIIYKEMPEYDWNDCVDWIETLRETTHLQWEMPGNEDYEVIYEIFNGSDSSTPNIEFQNRFDKWFTDIGGDKIFDVIEEYADDTYWSESGTDNNKEKYIYIFSTGEFSTTNWINIPSNCMSILFF